MVNEKPRQRPSLQRKEDMGRGRKRKKRRERMKDRERRKKRKNTSKINSFRAIEYFLKRCKMVKRKVIHEEKENRVLYIIGNGFDLIVV